MLPVEKVFLNGFMKRLDCTLAKLKRKHIEILLNLYKIMLKISLLTRPVQ